MSQGDDDPEEQVCSDDDDDDEDGTVPAARAKACIWRAKRERLSWRACTAAAGTTARVAYCAAALVHHAKLPVEALMKSKKKK